MSEYADQMIHQDPAVRFCAGVNFYILDGPSPVDSQPSRYATLPRRPRDIFTGDQTVGSMRIETRMRVSVSQSHTRVPGALASPKLKTRSAEKSERFIKASSSSVWIELWCFVLRLPTRGGRYVADRTVRRVGKLASVAGKRE